MSKNHILVNDFMFCLVHGSEDCGKCFCDHRECNNLTIELEIADAVEQYDAFSLHQRPPINVYALGAVVVDSMSEFKGTERKYCCQTHDAVDCETCFDWAGRITREIEEKWKADQMLDRWQAHRVKWMDRVGRTVG